MATIQERLGDLNKELKATLESLETETFKLTTNTVKGLLEDFRKNEGLSGDDMDKLMVVNPRAVILGKKPGTRSLSEYIAKGSFMTTLQDAYNIKTGAPKKKKNPPLKQKEEQKEEEEKKEPPQQKPARFKKTVLSVTQLDLIKTLSEYELKQLKRKLIEQAKETGDPIDQNSMKAVEDRLSKFKEIKEKAEDKFKEQKELERIQQTGIEDGSLRDYLNTSEYQDGTGRILTGQKPTGYWADRQVPYDDNPFAAMLRKSDIKSYKNIPAAKLDSFGPMRRPAESSKIPQGFQDYRPEGRFQKVDDWNTSSGFQAINIGESGLTPEQIRAFI